MSRMQPLFSGAAVLACTQAARSADPLPSWNEGPTNGRAVLVRLPELDFVNDKAAKPVAIEKFIGRRPIAAFGNSNGDLQMLQWTAAGSGPRLCVVVHHTDAEREWAYDRDSHIGRLDTLLDVARSSQWPIVDMRNDWTVIYPPER